MEELDSALLDAYIGSDDFDKDEFDLDAIDPASATFFAPPLSTDTDQMLQDAWEVAMTEMREMSPASSISSATTTTTTSPNCTGPCDPNDPNSISLFDPLPPAQVRTSKIIYTVGMDSGDHSSRKSKAERLKRFIKGEADGSRAEYAIVLYANEVLVDFKTRFTDAESRLMAVEREWKTLNVGIRDEFARRARNNRNATLTHSSTEPVLPLNSLSLFAPLLADQQVNRSTELAGTQIHRFRKHTATRIMHECVLDLLTMVQMVEEGKLTQADVESRATTTTTSILTAPRQKRSSPASLFPVKRVRNSEADQTTENLTAQNPPPVVTIEYKSTPPAPLPRKGPSWASPTTKFITASSRILPRVPPMRVGIPPPFVLLPPQQQQQVSSPPQQLRLHQTKKERRLQTDAPNLNQPAVVPLSAVQNPHPSSHSAYGQTHAPNLNQPAVVPLSVVQEQQAMMMMPFPPPHAQQFYHPQLMMAVDPRRTMPPPMMMAAPSPQMQLPHHHYYQGPSHLRTY